MSFDLLPGRFAEGGFALGPFRTGSGFLKRGRGGKRGTATCMFICVAEENCADQECVGDIIFACMNGNMQPKIHRSATTYSVLNSISDTLSGRPPFFLFFVVVRTQGSKRPSLVFCHFHCEARKVRVIERIRVGEFTI